MEKTTRASLTYAESEVLKTNLITFISNTLTSESETHSAPTRMEVLPELIKILVDKF